MENPGADLEAQRAKDPVLLGTTLAADACCGAWHGSGKASSCCRSVSEPACAFVLKNGSGFWISV